jgi:urate oxidase
VCEVAVDRGGRASIVSGLDGLVLLKTTDSAFAGFPRDRYTTLKETRDRIMASSVSARWTHSGEGADFEDGRGRIRTAMIAAFAAHKSESVQHTLFAMGEAALATAPEITQVRLSMPNQHRNLVDLSPFGMTNQNEVFVTTSEPYGLIEATIGRD